MHLRWRFCLRLLVRVLVAFLVAAILAVVAQVYGVSLCLHQYCHN